VSDFCEHCQGQRFDRARVIRALRQARQQARAARSPAAVDEGLLLALKSIRALDLPHLEVEDSEDLVVH
jgi:hypothetical protein